MKKLLMVAFHFPPLAGSSGIQRTLRFAQHLPMFGWRPSVLTVNPIAYEQTNDELIRDIPCDTLVRRAYALDTSRHLSIAGRYIGALARPDRWMSWKFDAVRQGMQLIRQFRFDAIWSTYPIATAHLIGAELHKRTGIPWIADFRDPMAQHGYPADPLTWRRFKSIEQHAVETARCSTFTTPSAARTYRARYPQAADRIGVLENGYDEGSFAGLETSGRASPPLNPGHITLLHSGIVYPSERDPSQLFVALGRLKASGAVRGGQLKIRFRAAVHEMHLHRLAVENGVDDWIETCPAVGYRDALEEMLRADALLVLQAANCNEQIPAKIYEYLRARKPILCLSDLDGDTAAVLREAGIDAIAALDSADAIARMLPGFLEDVRSHRARLPSPRAVASASRLGRTESLARCLDAAIHH